MLSIFWNYEARRLRLFWRLLAAGILFALGTGAVSVVFALIGVIGQLLTSSGFDPAQVEQILRHPLVNAFGVAATLLMVLAVTALAARFVDRRPWGDLGFHFDRRWWGDLGFGLALGAVLMGGVFLVELAAGWVTVADIFHSGRLSFPMAIFLQVVLFVSVGIYEEVLFRGYFLRNLAEGSKLPVWGARGALLFAWVLSSALFGLAHLANPNADWVSTFNIALAGIFLGIGYVFTGELAIPIGVHITWNFFQGNVFGFPVSGGASGVSFIAIEQGGPSLWTGGAFGPEAGLLGLAAMLIGSVLTYGWVYWRRGRPALHTPLAEYTPRVEQGIRE